MASPWGEGFFCRAIFKKIGFSHQLSQSAKSDSRAQPLPRGSGQRSWTQGVRSTTEGEIFKGTDGACADPGTQNFPCHGGGAAGGQGHSQFNSINFYVTHRFFVTFFPEESNVPPVPSFLPLLTPSRTARPRTCRACAPWSGRSARPKRPRWSAHSGWDQNPSPWP